MEADQDNEEDQYSMEEDQDNDLVHFSLNL